MRLSAGLAAVLFKQKRYGFNNESIDIYKFRSMYADQADLTASKLVTKGDPRVTRVGRFIRKTSFDELPQLFNVVFTGSLSLVGPRPHAVHAKAENRLYDEAVDGYFARHRVKPGITGWAQIHGWHGETRAYRSTANSLRSWCCLRSGWSAAALRSSKSATSSRRSSTSARRSICASRRSCSRACLAAAIRRGFRFCAAATSWRR
jgi:hypothetical protein